MSLGLNAAHTNQLTFELRETLRNSQMRTIIRYITVENKISCLCFVISERPTMFDRMIQSNFVDLDDIFSCIEFFPACMLNLPQDIMRSDGFQQEMLNRIKPEWYDFLPSFLSNNPEIKRKCNRTAKLYLANGYDKNGYDRNWVNENGELLSFFTLKGDFPINSKLDYYKLFKEYIESKLSVDHFCKKYGISSTKGFQEFLRRIEAENLEEFSKIREVKDDVQKQFFQISTETALKVATGEISLEEFLSNPKINFNSTNIEFYFGILSSTNKNKLALLIMDYIEQHPFLMNENMMKFLQARNLKPSDSLNTFVRKNLFMPKDRDYIQKYKKLMARISNHEKKWQRKNLYMTHIVGDQKYAIDDSVIDQAYAFASDNHYHISLLSLSYLCKEIATGEINYSQEVAQAKAEMVESVIALFQEAKSIEDYISIMKSRSIKEDEEQKSSGAKS